MFRPGIGSSEGAGSTLISSGVAELVKRGRVDQSLERAERGNRNANAMSIVNIVNMVNIRDMQGEHGQMVTIIC